ncbi:unnamed protein product [Mytilus coruscus]|uniref:Uncharacterized protein n=1 Tax=Mytilus coruscus TaxID=42192 RepID=A0A6J8DS10_MYTCO|nr:unnamed protein product [Mytilus coruscus]
MQERLLSMIHSDVRTSVIKAHSDGRMSVINDIFQCKNVCCQSLFRWKNVCYQWYIPIHTASSTVLDFHHYRACEQSFIKFHSTLNKGNRKRNIKYNENNFEQICADFSQSSQGEMNDVVKQIEKNVLKVREQLGQIGVAEGGAEQVDGLRVWNFKQSMCRKHPAHVLDFYKNLTVGILNDDLSCYRGNKREEMHDS